MTITFRDVDAEGVILTAPSGLEFGMHADTARALQKLLPVIATTEPARTATFEYTEGNPNELALMLGLCDVKEAVEFDAYPFTDAEGGDYFALLSEVDSKIIISATIIECMDKDVGDGFVGAFLVPLEDWDEFVVDFCKLEFVD